MRLRRLLLPIPVLLACCSLDVEGPKLRERALAEVARRETLWKALGIHDYDVNFHRACYGIPCDSVGLQPVTIHVRGGGIDVVLDHQGSEVLPRAGVSWPTVDSLFLWARQYMNDGLQVVEVQFDTTQHFPVLVRGEDPGFGRVVHTIDSLVVQPVPHS